MDIAAALLDRWPVLAAFIIAWILSQRSFNHEREIYKRIIHSYAENQQEFSRVTERLTVQLQRMVGERDSRKDEVE